VTPELAALMRKVDRDIAGLAQAVNELRMAQQQAGQQASQASQQASDDAAKAADEIKTGVNQLARSIVRAEQEEQAARPKPAAPQARAATPAPPTRTATPAPRNRRAMPMYYSPRDAEAQLLR
jgi:translation initiation factor IF-2